MNSFSTTVKCISAFFAALTGVLGTQPAAGQAFPGRAVTIVVPYPPGGGTDAVARSLGQALSRHWGQAVIVNNVAGADGVIGTQRVLRAPADGYTLVISTPQILLWKASMPDAKIDVLNDFRLVSKLQDSPLALAASSKLPVASVKDVVAYCKSPQHTCSWGSGTVYSRMLGSQMMDLMGLKDAVRVPFNGTGPMITSVIGGHVTLGLAPLHMQTPHARSGTLKVLAIVSKDRAGTMPQIPTLEQEGYPVYGTGWIGLMVSRATPQPVFEAISSAVSAVASNEALRASIVASGGYPIFSTPAQFETDLKHEIEYLDPIMVKYPPVNK